MSGSEGPDYRIGRGSGGASDCQGLVRDKPLQGPVPGVADTLTVGDNLPLLFDDSDYPSIAVLNDAGKVAGYIGPDGPLIDCIRLGVEYRATVTRIHGGSIMLRVETP